MKLWTVEVIQPKRTDRRKSRFRILYTVHAKSALAAKKVMLDSVYVNRDETIGKIVPTSTAIFNPRYFSIGPDADI